MAPEKTSPVIRLGVQPTNFQFPRQIVDSREREIAAIFNNVKLKNPEQLEAVLALFETCTLASLPPAEQLNLSPTTWGYIRASLAKTEGGYTFSASDPPPKGDCRFDPLTQYIQDLNRSKDKHPTQRLDPSRVIAPK